MIVFTMSPETEFREEDDEMIKTQAKANRRVMGIGAALALLCLALVTAQPATADFVQGELSFAGSFAPTGGTGLQDATGITFPSPALVVGATGDFAGSSSLISLISLNGFTFTSLPVDLWAYRGYTFSLTSLSSPVTQTPTSLALNGTGMVTGNLRDATPFSWNLAGVGSPGTLPSWRFFVSTASASVAEPSEFSTLALLVMGISTLGVWSRKRRQAIHL